MLRPLSTLPVNNLTFSVIRYEPNSSSLLLSPQIIKTPSSPSPAQVNCKSPIFLSIPNRPINLSATPFRIADASCSRLSFLRPCSLPSLPNCSHCPWECKLVKNPIKLLHDCASPHRPVTQQGCQSDVLGFLDDFLKLGIELEWDESQQDPYFSSCRACRLTDNGVCGFNVSEPNKQFLCFRTKSLIPWVVT